REAVVEETAGSTGHETLDPVEGAFAARRLVETEADKVVEGAARLGIAERDDPLNVARPWVRVAHLVRTRVAQEVGDGADGGETEAGDERVLRGVSELVEGTLLEVRFGRQQLDAVAVRRVRPTGRGDDDGRVLVAEADAQGRLCLVERRRRIRQ